MVSRVTDDLGIVLGIVLMIPFIHFTIQVGPIGFAIPGFSPIYIVTVPFALWGVSMFLRSARQKSPRARYSIFIAIIVALLLYVGWMYWTAVF